ncbi:guanylate kinase [Paenibacillus baekrokdamisoli]|uniref:Guanylate kinase n=1 Tax=Paenibacillus baekrokdamisoli TaxID=1712516 RepID=A0A3G9JAG9_9BACL|nr:guanylate kinase [Paenibacillus baekrokdamisoli]MBB3068105.1 guanylate kinase [Paenibacillus baekrokdamisoli]BBH22851.1 guanylate kinase [Paenibacillus baekrokdamisoli]
MGELKERELIFVFTGPDGSGRKSVADSVGTTLGLTKVLSYATRKPRPGEVNGQDYHFITPELYGQLDDEGGFIENVTINHIRYGLRDKDIERSFQHNGCIYLILDPEGAEILKRTYGDHVIRIFIYADRNTVEQRQRDEGQLEDVIAARLSHYEADIAYQSQCEHAFENYDLAHTVFDITNTLEGYLERNLVERD